MSSDTEEKVRVKVDEEVEFLLTQEQLRMMEITSKEGDSFYSCVTSCHNNSFEEFDSAVSLMTDHSEKSFMQEYEDITPVPSESEITPTTSFTNDGGAASAIKSSMKFPTPSPRKLEAVALLSARFNLIHPTKINIIPASPLKLSDESPNDREVFNESFLTDTSYDTTEDKRLLSEVPNVAISKHGVVKVDFQQSPRGFAASGEKISVLNIGREVVSKDEEKSVPKVEEISVLKIEEISVPKVEEKSVPKVEEKSVPKVEEKSVPKVGAYPISTSCNSLQPPRDVKLPPSRAIRPPTKTSRQSTENRENISVSNSDRHNATLNIDSMSSRLLKNPRPKKLQEQSFKGSPVRLSKLLTPNKSKVTSKVAKFIKTGSAGTQQNEKQTPTLRTVPTESRIPKKCFIQSARVFGKPLVPENLMKSPKPLITIHKHAETDKSRQIHINESVYETFEAVATKK